MSGERAPLTRLSARRTPVLNLLLATAVSVVAIGLAEGLARLVERRLPDPEGESLALWAKEWGDDYYVLGSHSVGWPAHEPVNRDGLPDRIHAEEKPEGVFRLAILGDSVTAGTPFEPSESFPYALQQRLDARSPWVEVQTVALWGWSTRQQRYAFDKIARRYRPDVALLAVCLNDMEELQNNLSRPPGWLGRLYKRSALLRRIVNADARSVRNVEDLLVDTPNTRRAHERFFAELGRLQADVTAAGARLVVMVLPMQAQVEGRSHSRLPQERVSAYCLEHGIRYLDPLPALHGAAGLFEDVVHFTPDARVRIAEYLLSTGLIPEERGGIGALSRVLSRAAEDAPAASVVAALREAPDARARAEAAWLLGRREPNAWPADAVQALLAALRDPSEAVRAEAARALGRAGERTARVVGPLCQALADPRQAVRWRAIEALVALSPPIEVLWPGLEASLRHPDVHVRAGAAFCLRGAGPGAAAAAPAVRSLVQDVDPGVRVVAIRALPELGATDAATVAALEGALRGLGEVDDVRRHAARALGRLREHALGAAPALVEALRDPNGLLRVEAATALGLIRPPQPEVVPALVEATADEGATVRRAAALALGRMGAVEPARAALVRLQDDEDDAVREAARRVLSTSAGSRER